MKKVGIICAIVFSGLAVGALVFFGLMPKINYAAARDLTKEILGSRKAVEALLDAKESRADIIDNFEAALETIDKDMDKLATADVQNDKGAGQRFEESKKSYAKIERLGRIWGDVKRFESLSDEDVAELQKSESKAIKEIADGLAKLRQKKKEYNEKYGAGKKASDSLIVDFSGVWLDAAELEEKARKLSLDDILGMSRDDILEFYAKMEELDNYISEK